jgi:hypothetical protein
MIRDINGSKHILEQVVELMSEEVGVDMRQEFSDEIGALTKYGEHLLYPESTLYRKYVILHTFYKNLSTATLSLGIVYVLVNFNYINANIKKSGQIGLALIIVAGICYLGQRKWRRKSNRAFFNDLHQLLNNTSG